MSTPNSQPGVTSAAEHDIKSPAFWFDANAHSILNEGSRTHEHRFGKLKAAELAWVSAFQKNAPRLKLSVLNITSISEARVDARVPGTACQHFCYPGLPHHWSEMFLRLIEQSTYGATDGL